MAEFLIYQGKAAIALAAFYMFYRLLLSKETFHRFNRIVLLGTAALAFVLPFCVITLKEVVIIPVTSVATDTYVGEVAETVAMIPEASEPIWSVILCSLFASGALVILAKIVISIISIKRIISNGSKQILESGEALIITETDTAPFSWMKYIVISREDYESGYSQILTHEKAHIALRHSWDILFVDMITALQWFNPAIWMLKADLRALHEFEADDAVLRNGANIKEYQYLLIRKAVSKSGYSVANSFNHSTLKQRITMMSNKKSSRTSAWKALYIIPLVGISLAATAETKVDYQYEDQQPIATADTLDNKDSENWYKVEHVVESGKSTSTIEKSLFTQKNLTEGKIVVDKVNNAFTLYFFDTAGKELQTNYTGIDLNKDIFMLNGAIVTQEIFDMAAGKDPEVVMLVAYLNDNNKIKAAVTASGRYVTGNVNVTKEQQQNPPAIMIRSNVTVGNNDENATESQVSNLLYIVNGEKMSKDFDLNTIDPKNIESIEVLKTEDSLKEYGAEGKEGVIRITLKDGDKQPVPFQQVALKPGFNGGDVMEFSKYVSENLIYPENCRQSKIQGMVTIEFTITETGKLADIRILRGVNEDLDREAVRVIAQSPLWTPGRDENGKVVPVKYVYPVLFEITD